MIGVVWEAGALDGSGLPTNPPREVGAKNAAFSRVGASVAVLLGTCCVFPTQQNGGNAQRTRHCFEQEDMTQGASTSKL